MFLTDQFFKQHYSNTRMSGKCWLKFCWLNYCWQNPEKHLLTTVLTFGTCVGFVVTNLIENVRFWGNGSEYNKLLKSMCTRHLLENTFNPFPYKLKIWENRIWIEQGRDTDFNITWNVLVSRIHWIFTKTSNFEIKISQKNQNLINRNFHHLGVDIQSRDR